MWARGARSGAARWPRRNKQCRQRLSFLPVEKLKALRRVERPQGLLPLVFLKKLDLDIDSLLHHAGQQIPVKEANTRGQRET